MLCVFDCESVPDVGLLRKVYGYKGSDVEVCEAAFAAQKELTTSEFLPLPFHQIVCISAVICDDYGNFIKVGNYAQNVENPSEEAILGEFLKYLNRHNPKLVSYNGRGFDLPLIMLRAMRYDLDAVAYFEQDNASVNKNKWENYRARYSESFHIDLLESLGNFGAARGMRLDWVCQMLNLPGKFDIDGSQVYALYYADSRADGLRKISDYCQSDVLNTYWLYLKYQLLQGKITIGEYHSLLRVLYDKIPGDRDYSEVFKKSLRETLGEE